MAFPRACAVEPCAVFRVASVVRMVFEDLPCPVLLFSIPSLGNGSAAWRKAKQSRGHGVFVPTLSRAVFERFPSGLGHPAGPRELRGRIVLAWEAEAKVPLPAACAGGGRRAARVPSPTARAAVTTVTAIALPKKCRGKDCRGCGFLGGREKTQKSKNSTCHGIHVLDPRV